MKREVIYDFSGSVALVTGAAKGMGLATAKAFAEAGAKVIMADVDMKTLEMESAKIAKNGGKSLPVKYDA
jgi:NAD(P)-dependent dehydrogenase (short-subunit alcohol dehydrogenase family)